MPIAEDRQRLKCGVAIVNLRRGSLVAQFEFKSGVDEIFDVSVISGDRLPAMQGPYSREDGEKTIWAVPTRDNGPEPQTQ